MRVISDETREKLRAAGQKGGMRTLEVHGRWHMSAIGKAGRQVCVERHGEAYWRGLVVDGKGWKPRVHQLAYDLQTGRALAGR